jgi:hypothetical protein
MVRVNWMYRADGGSDALVGSKQVAIVGQDGEAFTVTWVMSGSVQRFTCSRYAREAVHAAAAEAPWDASGKPERVCAGNAYSISKD